MIIHTLHRRSALALGIACLVPRSAAGEADRPASLARTVTFDIGAREGRQPWRIMLYVPPGAPPAAGWPALFLLDGGAVAGTAIDIARVQGAHTKGSGVVPFVVVAIGYPTDEPYDFVRRSWDYSPPPGRTYPPFREGAPSARTGGATEFLAFLRDELKPAVAARCPLDPARLALFGHSFGGLFALYALGQAPDTFSIWIASSPSIFWEDGVVLPSIEALERRPEVCARVLLSAGEYEDRLAPFQERADDREAQQKRLAVARTLTLAREMAERLARHPGLEVGFKLVPGRTHMSMLPEAVNDAVAFAFGPERGSFSGR